MNTIPCQLPRRGFLRATACAVLCDAWLHGVKPSANAQTQEPPMGRVRVALADFPALDSVNGSVYLNVATSPPGIYPVVLTRTGAEAFAAVSSECAHNGCVVQLFSAGLGLIQCNCHGSQYTAQGVVVRGPAQRNLPTYSLRRVGTHSLEIDIPGIGYALAAAVVNPGAEPRLRVTFPTVAGLSYAVTHRATVTGLAAPQAFSLTPTGALNQTSLTGTGTDVTVYLPATDPTGFLSITRR